MATPLAEQLRPQSIEEFAGQEHLIGKGKPLTRMLESGNIYSMIFWGPPGCGKTTLARLIANRINARFVTMSAVTGSKSEVMGVVKQAREYRQAMNRDTILFLDEIHRFNKAQQDAFLPFVEDGTIILIGATTENPGFSINAPLLSRSRVFQFYPLTDKDIKKVLKAALVKYPKHKIAPKALDLIIDKTGGDARAAINAIEMAAGLAKNVTVKVAEDALQKRAAYYDKKGDSHYDTVSAFIKSMRGNDANATLYYLARMLKAGEDPMFIARRMVIFASEDIGNARPNALVLATTCMQAVHMIGMPEASLILAQTASYLATVPKSIASTVGITEALADVDVNNPDPIPLHLRNPATKFSKQIGYGEGHTRYVWLEEKKTGKKIKQQYLPDKLRHKKYYRPDWQ